MSRLCLSVLFVLAFVTAAAAQEPANPEDVKRAEARPQNDGTLDLSVPEAPAFAILDLTPENVTRPTTPRELGLALLNGVDRDGNFQSGLALDFAPYMLSMGDSLTLDDWRNDPLERFLGRTSLSLATTKGSSDDDKSVRIALGALVTPVDYGDPRLDDSYLGCLGEILNHTMDEKKQQFARVRDQLAELPPDAQDKFTDIFPLFPDIDPKRFELLTEKQKDALIEISAPLYASLVDYILARGRSETYADEALPKCREAARKRNWNATSWQIGGAPTWTSESGGFDELKGGAGAVWTSLSLGLRDDGKETTDLFTQIARRSQLIMQARYRFAAEVADPDNEGELIEQDDILAGARLRIASPGYPAAQVGSFAVSLEGSYVYENAEGRRSTNRGRFSVGGDVKIAKDLWLDLSIGGESGGGDDSGQGFVLSAFRWGFPTEPTIPVPGETPASQ